MSKGWRSRLLLSLREKITLTNSVWIGKHLLQGCAVTMEDVDPGAALGGVTQTLVIPRRAGEAVRKRVTGKHLHCRADVTQPRASSPSSQISVLSCKSHPQEHPKSIQSLSLPAAGLGVWGSHSGSFPFLPRGEIFGEERVPFHAVFIQDENLFWP